MGLSSQKRKRLSKSKHREIRHPGTLELAIRERNARQRGTCAGLASLLDELATLPTSTVVVWG